MTKIQFLDAVNGIDDEFINELAETPTEPNELFSADAKPQVVRLTSKPVPFWKIAIPTAAAVCVITAGVFSALRLRTPQTKPSPADSTPAFLDFAGEYPENPIPIMTLSKDEIRQAINAQPNFKCADNLYVMAPESASVYEYTTYSTRVPQFVYPAEQYRKDFEQTFKYFFPDREIDPNYLKYSIYNWDTHETEEGYVSDKEELPDDVRFTYDETPENPLTRNDGVYMQMYHVIGCGGGFINKGEAARLSGIRQYDGVQGYMPLTHYPIDFPTVATYAPQSEESYRLLDGEMRICDAVKFFEEYINNAPISTGLVRNCRTVVYNVKVLRIGDGIYGYYFRTVEQFRGVNYEPAIFGSKSLYDYSGSSGQALMIRSDDIDFISEYYGSDWTADMRFCESVISPETAIKTISGKLSDSVTFEVKTVEFVYVLKYAADEQGHINIETYEGSVTPAWRITMQNLNDDLTYSCYVDAKDGENFRYFTSKAITNYD